MSSIRVVGEEECQGADVERDEWISLIASWWPGAQAQPLYLLVSGTDGGEVELKVDPETGSLLKIIVIEAPPAQSAIGAGSPRFLLSRRTSDRFWIAPPGSKSG